MELDVKSMFLLMLTLNVVLWLFQGAYAQYDDSPVIFNTTNSPLDKYTTGNSFDTMELTTNTDILPETTQSINPTTGNVFTDSISTIKNWFSSKLSGLSWIKDFLLAPYSFVKTIGLAQPIAVAFGVIWYGMALLLLGMLIINRQ